MIQKKCIECSRKMTWIGLFDSILLAIFKGTVGVFTHSRALVASSLYTIHDVISSIAILIGLSVAEKPLDEEHPYGHGNIEYIVSVFTSLIILGGTIFILFDCMKIIFHGEHSSPHWAAFGAAIISAFANEIIYRYNICAVKHINSPAIMAHAQHHRADAISSIAVVFAIFAGKFGFHFFDTLVAVFEAGHLIYLSVEILYHGSLGLMDRSADPRVHDYIRRIASLIPGVEKISGVKTRQIGRAFWVDVDVILPVDIPIIQADRINNRIKQTLMAKIKYIGNVNILNIQPKRGDKE